MVPRAGLGAGWVGGWRDVEGVGYLEPDVKVTALEHLNLTGTCTSTNYILEAALDQIAWIVHTIFLIGTVLLPSAFGLTQFLIFPTF